MPVVLIVLEILRVQFAACRQAFVCGASIIDCAKTAVGFAVYVVELGGCHPIIVEIMFQLGKGVGFAEFGVCPVVAQIGIGVKACIAAAHAHRHAKVIRRFGVALVEQACGYFGVLADVSF